MLGEIIGAGLGLAGSLFGQSKEAKLQKEFAKKGIQWKVADAKAAGIHPLYALGANTVSYAPQQLGASLSDAGQSLGRAVSATMDQGERGSLFDRTVRDLQTRNLALQNEKLAAEIRLVNQAGNPPAAPGGGKPIIAGQGDARIPLDPDANAMRIVLPRADDSKKDTWVAGAATNSQTIADQYGDAAQEIYGLLRLGIDSYRNLVKPYSDPVLARAQGYLSTFDSGVPAVLRRPSRFGRR